jgi:hypothetical protein
VERLSASPKPAQAAPKFLAFSNYQKGSQEGKLPSSGYKSMDIAGQHVPVPGFRKGENE